MSESASIDKLSVKHHTLMDMMLANPFLSGEELAALTGMSRPWISTIIHSDCFKAELASRRSKLTDVLITDVVGDLRARISAAAEVGVERVSRLLSAETDIEKAQDATAMLLDALDMGPSKKVHGPPMAPVQVGVQILNGSVPQNAFQQARSIIDAKRESHALPNPVGGPSAESVVSVQSGPAGLPPIEANGGAEGGV